MKAKTFWGGIHPEYKKEWTSGKSIKTLPSPAQVVVPLQQHIGAPAQVVVKKGDQVLAGQRIAEAQGMVSAHVHAPISGTVVAVEMRPHSNGSNSMAVVIASDGRDEWVSMDKHVDPIQMSRAEIKDRVLNAGIVGMGGAAFPTHVKLSPPADTVLDYLILNGSECEPYLTADHRMMLEYAADVALGTQLLAKACGAKKVMIGIETNKMDAIAALKRVAGNIEIVPLAVKYPEGGEKQLIKAVTGREVPSNGLPYQAGVVVQNVGTAVAVAQAVRDGRPLTHRVVTVTGSGIAEPGNYLVPIGTSFADVVDAAGGLKEGTVKVVSGGPMMGAAQVSLDVPVIKGTSGILALSKGECQVADPIACIKCSRCVDVCPAYLLPTRIERAAIKGHWDETSDFGAMDCIECGSCTYICPSKRYLLHYIRVAKAEINAVQRKQAK